MKQDKMDVATHLDGRPDRVQNGATDRLNVDNQVVHTIDLHWWLDNDTDNDFVSPPL